MPCNLVILSVLLYLVFQCGTCVFFAEEVSERGLLSNRHDEDDPYTLLHKTLHGTFGGHKLAAFHRSANITTCPNIMEF